MRTALATLTIGAFLSVSLPASMAQDDEKKAKSEAVQKRLKELFEICKGDDFSKAAPYLVYRGGNKERKWKDVYDYATAEEKQAVDDTCKRIKKLLKESDSCDFGAFKVEKESEGEWCILEVVFKKGDTTTKKLFACLKVKDAYSLGNID